MSENIVFGQVRAVYLDAVREMGLANNATIPLYKRITTNIAREKLERAFHLMEMFIVHVPTWPPK